MPLQSIEQAIEALQRGDMIIVVDDEDRENEGDFVCGAETITPAQVDLMLRVGRGTLCVPMASEDVTRLKLRPVVEESANTAPNRTAFLRAVDHVTAGTGVSAENRARTIKALADPQSQPEEFLLPGHVNPLLAMDGGVLRRAGHTEATTDLLRLAGKRPVGALIEICSQHGHGMADYAELQDISRQYKIPMISIADLIRYRRIRERLVTRAVSVEIQQLALERPPSLPIRLLTKLRNHWHLSGAI